MLKIEKVNGKVTSYIGCDICRKGWKWESNVSITRMERIARDKGWKMGKTHICEKCKTNRPSEDD